MPSSRAINQALNEGIVKAELMRYEGTLKSTEARKSESVGLS